MRVSAEIKDQLLASLWTKMASLLVSVLLTEFLISKVTMSHLQRYPTNPYAVRDPRSLTPYQDYSSYYAAHALGAASQGYPRSAGVFTPSPKPVQYRQSSYPSTQETLQSTVQRPMEFRASTYPAQTAAQKVQKPVIYQSPYYPKQAESVSPVLQIQKPVEYLASPSHQRTVEYATPVVQNINLKPAYHNIAPQTQPIEMTSIQSTMEFPSPSYQTTPDMLSPMTPLSLEYHQPVYRKVAEFIANQKPLEYQGNICHSDLTDTLQTSQIPKLTTSALETLQALALSKSDCSTPKSSSGSLDTNVLNNLAIALQLLIVNNIMNHDKPEPVDSMSELAYPTDLAVSNPFIQAPCEMCNAKFLGSSNFVDDNLISKGMLGLGTFGTSVPLPRPGLKLMSPYDAIASTSCSSSPFSDSTSLFALKNSFQSPYAAVMASDNNKDLFSMTDLF